eukprot:5461379-Prymnesium_polylepis.2
MSLTTPPRSAMWCTSRSSAHTDASTLGWMLLSTTLQLMLPSPNRLMMARIPICLGWCNVSDTCSLLRVLSSASGVGCL